MLNSYKELEPQQLKDLKDSVAWITVLIAGADGKIDSAELDWAKKVADIRTYAAPDPILEFFTEVGKDFDLVLESTIQESSEETEERTKQISLKLEKLNSILPLFEKNYGITIYKSLLSFSKHVANSTGGFLRFFSIGSAEAKLVGLPMVNPIGE